MSVSEITVSDDFPRALFSQDTKAASILDDVVNCLAAPSHFVVLKGLPPSDNSDACAELARCLARRSPQKKGIATDQLERISLTRVEVKEEWDPIKQNATAYSRTNQPITLHTDSSYRASPHEFVAFQMVRPDQTGGETLLVTVEHVLEAIDDLTRQVLSFPIYPLGKQRMPIFWESQSGPHIRYYRSQLDLGIQKADPPLPDAAFTAIEALDAALADESRHVRFRLEAGDILCLHNTKVLHGRTVFAENSDRLMFRIRADVGCIG